ncbi:MAG: cell division protein ZapA [Bacteroidales bacterium]|nr:cell division protein ZapA [Bacteroidales bacterium]
MGKVKSIIISIADKNYTLSIKEEDEIIIRSAAELINNKISDFSKNYIGKDKQDILAMILLQTSAELLKKENIGYTDDGIFSRLNEINQLLKEAV